MSLTYESRLQNTVMSNEIDQLLLYLQKIVSTWSTGKRDEEEKEYIPCDNCFETVFFLTQALPLLYSIA